MQGHKSFEVRWHPFFLNPDAPKEGVNKLDMYKQKFGEQRVQQILPMMTVYLEPHLHLQIPDSADIQHLMSTLQTVRVESSVAECQLVSTQPLDLHEHSSAAVGMCRLHLCFKKSRP